MINQNIKVIETSYKGYRFRSRLEARWAVFFDALGVEWVYEPDGYDLVSLGRYLPDFFLPEYGLFAEVKPGAFSPEEQAKCYALREMTGYKVLMLDGIPEYKPYFLTDLNEDPVLEYGGAEGEGGIEDEGVYLTRLVTSGCFPCHHCESGDSWGGYCGEEFQDTINAVIAARSARFEYGEKGSTL